MSSISSSSPFPDAPHRSLSILVADDALESQQTIQRWLEEMGHRVMCVSCGNDAVRLIREQTFDVVITEVIMANGDGLEVILELKKRQPAARSIAMSGGGRYLPPADCLRVAKGLGAHEILLKPMRRDDLIASVDRLVGSSVTVPAA